MGKKLRKVLASCLALSMCVSMLSVAASATEIADEPTTGTVKVETSAGEYKDVDVTITFDNNTGDTTYTAEDVDTGDGIVDYNGVSNETTGESKSEYTVDNGKYHAEGGSETTVEKGGISDPDGIKVNVSLTEGGQNTATGDASTDPVKTGDTKDSPEEGDYNYTSTTVKEQASVTVTTKDVTVEDIVDVDNDENGTSDLTYVSSSTNPTETNDLYKEEESVAPDQYLPGNENAETAEGDEYQFVSDSGYQFEYVGSGNTSQFRPAVVFTEPLTDEQKVEQYGDHYESGAFIHKDYLARYFVDWLDEEDKAKIPAKVAGQYVTDDAGYLLDVDGNRVLKNEWTMVGPDGKTYYLHRFDANGVNNYVEGWYQDGEWVEELNGSAEINESTGKPVSPIKVQKVDKDGNPVVDDNGAPVCVTVTTDYKTYKDENGKKVYVVDEDGNILVSYGAVWSGAQQFVLVDKETGEVVTTYCADIATHTQKNFGYNVVNLEDSTYYDDAQAKQIRTIATNGYWGTIGTEIKIDENGNTVYQTDEDGELVLDETGAPIPVEVPKSGSLAAMKEMLLASGNFTKEELESLNDGVALSATQMAIWSCSNHMAGAEFVNTNYVETQYTTGYVPQDKEDETKLMFKIYEYLTHLDPTEIEKPTTADTIINANNFLKDMSVTVIEKAENHENNKNESDDDDAYVTDLSFALVVTPSTENGDDLVVKVLDKDGNELASGRIAGTNKEGEDYTELTADENGNYTLSGITMVEGEQNFNITLEGIQNLKEGVYLYTSEIDTADDENPDNDVSSQTMVGMASGEREVGVSMNLNFELSVEDEIVVTEHVWRGDWVDGSGGASNPPSGGETPPSGGETPPAGGEQTPEEFIEIPEEEIPLVNVEQEEIEEIPEDDIPLADVPKTGDASALWMLMSALSGSGLLGLAVLEKKRKED